MHRLVRGRSVGVAEGEARRPVWSHRLRLTAGVATMAAGLAAAGQPAAATPADIVFLDSCSSGPCAQFTPPVPSLVVIGSALTVTDRSAMLIYGQGSAVSTRIVDGSLAGLLAAVDPSGGSATVDALSQVWTARSGQASLPSAMAPFAAVLGAGAHAQAEFFAAQAGWQRAGVLVGSSGSVSAEALLPSLTDREYASLLKSDLAALPIAADGTVAVADARLALDKALFGAHTPAEILTRFPGDQGFYDLLGTLKAADGSVSIEEVATSLGFYALPADQRAERMASLERMRAALAGREVGGAGSGRYMADDLFVMAEMDGEAGDMLGAVAVGDRVSLRAAIARVLADPTGYFRINGLAAFRADAATAIGGAAMSTGDAQIVFARLLLPAQVGVAGPSGSLAALQTGASGFATVYVENTTAPTLLTTVVPITATGGTGLGGVVVRSTGGAIAIDNRGPVTVSSDDGVGVVGLSTGGSVTVVNSGDVTVSGNRAGGLVARGPTGALTIENDGRVALYGNRGSGIAADAGGGGAVIRVVNRGAVRVSGDGNAGVGAFQTSATATAINEGTIDVLGSRSVGLASSAVGGGAATTINRGTVRVSAGAASAGLDATSVAGSSTLFNGGTVDVAADAGTGAMVRSGSGSVGVRNEGRIAFAGATGAAVTTLTGSGSIDVANLGTLSTVGDRTGGLAVTTTSGTVTIDNRGEITARGAESAGVVAVAGSAVATLANAGTISATGDRSVGVSVATDGVARIVNGGLISAAGQDAVALRTSGSGRSEIGNFGAIGGAVRLGAGADVVANFGAIVGDVDLGDGDDTYGTAIGAVVGKVAGGNGTDTLVHVGDVGQRAEIDGAVFTGFERALLIGPAAWRLSGDLSATAVTVDGGGFAEVAGQVGDVFVGAGSILGGTGRTGSLSAAGAMLVPGDGIASAGVGTLRVGGDLTLDGASRVVVDLRGTTSDSIAVDGRATLGGAMLTLRGVGLVGGTSFDVVTAGGGVAGTFASKVTWTDAGWDFLDVAVTYGANGVTVTVVDPVSAAVKTSLPSDAAFVTAVFDPGAAADAAKIAAYQQLGAMIDAAAGNPVVVRRVFDEVGGKATVEAITAGTQALRTVDQAVSRATDAVLGGGTPDGGGAGGMAMGYVDDRPATPAARAIAGITGSTTPAAMPRIAPSLIAWSTGQYGFGSSTSGTSSSDFRSGGLTVGLIRRFDDAFSLGVAGGWTRSDVTVANPGADLRVDSWHLLAHGTWDAPRFRLDGMVGYAFQTYESQRTVGTGRASASYDGGAFRAGFDAGWKVALGGMQFMPHAGVDVIHARTGGYTESGAGLFALSVTENTATTVDSKLGLKWSMRHKLAGGTTLAPQLDLAWVHGWGNATPTVHASMLGSSFVVTGASRARDAAAVSAGLTAEFGNGLSLSGRYAGRLASDLRAHDFSAGLKYQW